MRVSIIADDGYPSVKKLHLVASRGRVEVVPVLGAHAFLLNVSSSHRDDVQPSFAKNGVCIRHSDSMIGWIVAHPTAEDQRSFLDRLCGAGCIMRDLMDHIALSPHAAERTGDIILARTTSSRTTKKAGAVALKLASDANKMSQVTHEAQVLLSLRHDSIVGAHGLYEVKVRGARSLALVLDYKEGADLASWVPACGLPERMVQSMMTHICDALVYLHGILIVHKDIKPSNVLCERAEDGSVKVVLADFEFAAHVMDEGNMSRRCGTCGYIAPEMFQSHWFDAIDDEINATKIDMFSFGIMIYAAIFGRNPFGDGTQELTYQRNARGLVSLANFNGRSESLRYLLSGLCAKDPRDRFSSSEAFAHPWFSPDRRTSCSKDERKTFAPVRWDAFVRAADGLRMSSQTAV
jgi:serine/threonine protein kinase